MGRSTPPDIKAAAIADLWTGEQPAVVAERYGLDPAKVRVWKQRYVTPSVTDHVTSAVTSATAPIVRPSIEQRQARIAELIIEVLESRLEAQKAIAQHVRTNEAWVNNQSAADLAALDGHLHRSAVDVLDRMAGSRSADDDDHTA